MRADGGKQIFAAGNTWNDSVRKSHDEKLLFGCKLLLVSRKRYHQASVRVTQHQLLTAEVASM